MTEPTHYRRNLPHRQPENGVFNISFRLEGSLPKEVVIRLKSEYEQKKKELSKTISDAKLLNEAVRKERILYYGKFDELLDNASFGPTYLGQADIGQLVFDSFVHWHKEGRYKLINVTIMPNHVHTILYKIQKPLFRILQSIKTYTGTEANLILDRVGEKFWMQESYDHLIRNRDELGHWIRYNLNNPVKPGLCNHWSDWKLSFLHPEFENYAP
jgi:putative transposase